MAKSRSSGTSGGSRRSGAAASPKTTASAVKGTTAQSGSGMAKVEPTQEQIAKRAYEIWQAKGRPIGKDLENWQQAERELRNGGAGKW